MFRSLAVRNYRLFAMGQVVSNTGTWMQRIAQDWLVLQLSGGSGIALGITTAAQFLPMLVLGLWGGALVDRLDKRRLLIVTQASMGVLALGLGILATTGAAQVWHVYLFALALGVVTVVDNPARQTFVIEMVGKRDLPNAIALNGASFQLGRVTGPAVAGLLIGVIGSGPVFLVNALSFGAVLGGLFMMRTHELHPTEHAEKGKGQIRAGLRYIAGRPDIILLLAMTAFLSLFGTNIQNQIALMTNNVFEAGASAFGLAGTAIAVGSLAGALIAARRERPRLRLLVLAAFAFSLLQVVTALTPGYTSFLVALVPMGIAFLTYTTTMNATLQLTVDPTMRGRVMSLYLLFFLGMAPLGAPIVGWLADTFDPRVSLAVGGTVGMVVTVLTAVLLMRKLKVRAAFRWHGRPRLTLTRKSLAEEE
ncbi:MFS transporter [Spiractinospora alimapuensis]|uniref:MFS transporter n=1 Tax=Spiractinospora alimapuensis TaxID=2820884 RepID=UPI001F2DF6CF|nr:MFS transporter [Spiractinospora alimapuensis]QVQ54981.1 MFS transporter [Spiractinospora alimapuensis]